MFYLFIDCYIFKLNLKFNIRIYFGEHNLKLQLTPSKHPNNYFSICGNLK